MNLKSKVVVLLISGLTLLTFGCNQQQQKAESTTTSDSVTAPGVFDRTVLPIIPHPFAGVIDTNASKSKPDFPVEVSAPKGAPNVLVILTDDVGYGASS